MLMGKISLYWSEWKFCGSRISMKNNFPTNFRLQRTEMGEMLSHFVYVKYNCNLWYDVERKSFRNSNIWEKLQDMEKTKKLYLWYLTYKVSILVLVQDMSNYVDDTQHPQEVIVFLLEYFHTLSVSWPHL